MPDPPPAAEASDVELSIIIPCLNESDTVGICVKKAVTWLRDNGVKGEVILADNGSTDGSIELAEGEGARVERVEARGYGNALMGGIESARGNLIIMGDADDSYDFGDLSGFVRELRAGAELVQGCRLRAGGGRVLPGAMPFLHYWWGNPMFSKMARVWFDAPIHDVYCGLRGFTKDLYRRLDLRCTGMEFATEMVIKASLRKVRFAEVPITLHPDGRKSRTPHLRTFRDGWRTLRFFLLFSPRWLFLLPGAALILLGFAGYALALPGARIGPATFDAHTLLFASLSMLCGYQAVWFAIFTKVFAITEGILPEDARIGQLRNILPLERGLVAGALLMVTGFALLGWAVVLWILSDFGALSYAFTMRIVIPGSTLTALGVQTLFGSFFLDVLGLRRR
ncbi:MAG: glycosyltransferase family 2 protein [Terrimicrobiaceae bacterium]|nr:glycosyltransferase family 2 protein [Terrimicrobiaceae bacterium]